MKERANVSAGNFTRLPTSRGFRLRGVFPRVQKRILNPVPGGLRPSAGEGFS